MVGAGRFELPTPGPPDRNAMFSWSLRGSGCPALSLYIQGHEQHWRKPWLPLGCNFGCRFRRTDRHLRAKATSGVGMYWGEIKAVSGPWTVECLPGGFKVVDANGQSLAYFYARDNDHDANVAKVLTLR